MKKLYRIVERELLAIREHYHEKWMKELREDIERDGLDYTHLKNIITLILLVWALVVFIIITK